ncbi:hypothetical protein ASG36_09285 [Geodermatophilus sp. Leaf369]|uniref:FhaA domain-containing protein n=1 Tax=Geodermatophilus sp. Leaf369 TaxID=1736354 RepID=UPI0006FC46C8|nr:DUF3662 and FHA domain-containing protein [Geodermatophilus sp. Leaf369]KQS58287.1 hypothetical protein ASG36_09285 [Geodermatophilus sp. Leaf369]QNG36892.1 DUF2662 domain-containing protein [Geodermatophilaceae bacterium NBWT11]
MGVLQRFERRLEGMVGLAFARVFKGKVHPAEIAKALQREATEQRKVMGEGRVLVPNVYAVRLGRTDYDNLSEWSEQLAAELADMVAEHVADEGFQTFGDIQVSLELDEELHTGVFEVASSVADPSRPARSQARASAVSAGLSDDWGGPVPGHGAPAPAAAPGAPPVPGRPPLPPLPPLRGRTPDTGAAPSVIGRSGQRPGVTHVLVVDGPGTRHVLTPGSNVIGRGTEADVRLPDTGVSRKHVDVVLEGPVAAVQDLGSTNGTLVNGRRVGRQPLADGDVIRIGHSVLVYRQDGA